MLRNFHKVISAAARLVQRAIDQMRARAIPSEAIHSRKKNKFLSKLQLSDNILFKTLQKVGLYLKNWSVCSPFMLLFIEMLMDTGCYFYFFLVKLVKYFILFRLVDFCTTIISKINMINNVDEHPIPPIWRREKLIRLKTGCHATPLYPSHTDHVAPAAPPMRFAIFIIMMPNIRYIRQLLATWPSCTHRIWNVGS